jgi:hypothetical protein
MLSRRHVIPDRDVQHRKCTHAPQPSTHFTKKQLRLYSISLIHIADTKWVCACVREVFSFRVQERAFPTSRGIPQRNFLKTCII